jgi:hypothetical protein
VTRRRATATPLTLLTPIRAGEESELAAYLAQVPRGEDSPFRRLPRTHFARWVIVDQLHRDYPGAPVPGEPLAASYLMFTSTFDGTVREYVEELRIRLGVEADGVWGHCIKYPGRRRQGPFRRYLLHNRVPVHLSYAAYDATVAEVRAATDLRNRHVALARRVQGMDDLELQKAFRAEFGG